MRNLPKDCISHIISLTTPRDACRMSLVSPLFRLASDSDDVWEKFLPSDCDEMISRSVSTVDLNSTPKKALYFHLCDNLIIIANGNMGFRLDKESGKRCLMIGSRGLTFPAIWGLTFSFWIWATLPESRFSEVAELEWMCWYGIDIAGKIETSRLSNETTYGAYFVYKLVEQSKGFDQTQIHFRLKFEGQENKDVDVKAYLDPSRNFSSMPKDRSDGWMEIDMGEFFNEQGDDDWVLFRVNEYESDDSIQKSGLIVEGIELRPKAVIQQCNPI